MSKPDQPARETVIEVSGLSKSFWIGTYDRKSWAGDLRTVLTGAWRKLSRSSGASAGAAPPPALFWALKDLSFEVYRGEVFGILGHNGSGKSTLLKILARITKPTKGSVVIDKRIVSMLEVGTGFHQELTGRENVYLSGAIMGLTKSEVNAKFDDILAFSEIEDFIDTPVKRYSSGMFVRLAFAVATQLVSEVILIDEVLSVGDADFQRKSLAKIDELRKRGKTVVIVSHSLFHLEQICDRVMWLDHGQVKKIGSYAEIASAYIFKDHIPHGYVKFPERGGSHGAHLICAYTKYQDSAGWQFLPNQPLTLVIEYDVEHRVENLKIGFRIWNPMNVPILSADMRDQDIGVPGREVGEPGRKVVSVEIPATYLGPGQYLLEIGLWSPEVESHHHEIKALTFQILSASHVTEPLPEQKASLAWKLY
jgi:lipopolysaccharide transport system ATP-binding protein